MKANPLLAAFIIAMMLFAFEASAQQAAENNDPFGWSQVERTSSQIRSFSAIQKSGKTYLNWTATDAAGECIYIIERSTDGNNFQKIAVKKGAPSPDSEALLFSFIDEQPVKGTSTYRIQQVSSNGATQIATTQVTNNSANNGKEKLAYSK